MPRGLREVGQRTHRYSRSSTQRYEDFAKYPLHTQTTTHDPPPPQTKPYRKEYSTAFPYYSPHLRDLFHRFLLHGESYRRQSIPTDEGGTDLYWSLDEPILVTVLTYIARQEDQYRLMKRLKRSPLRRSFSPNTERANREDEPLLAHPPYPILMTIPNWPTTESRLLGNTAQGSLEQHLPPQV